MARSTLRTLIAVVVGAALPALVSADTVHLKNGAFINGVVLQRDDAVLVAIGDLGRLEIPWDQIDRIERNALTGEETAESIARRVSATVPEVPDADVGEDAGEPRGPFVGTDGDQPDVERPENAPVGDSELTRPSPVANGESNRGEAPQPGDVKSSVPQPVSRDDAEEAELDPQLQNEIDSWVTQLRGQNSKQRIRAEQNLREVGAPVVPFLLPLAQDSAVLVRIATFRILAELADERVVEVAIEALLDENEYVRGYADKALRRATNESFGYRARAHPARRRMSQTKWRKWWAETKRKRALNEEAARAQVELPNLENEPTPESEPR